MTNDQKEVLKLANECGASKLHSDSVIITECYAMTEDELLAFAAALEEKHRAKIAMLVDKLNKIHDMHILNIEVRKLIRKGLENTQQDTDAFIAEVGAKALKEAANGMDEYYGTDIPDEYVDFLRRRAEELRASAAQPEGKEGGK